MKIFIPLIDSNSPFNSGVTTAVFSVLKTQAAAQMALSKESIPSEKFGDARENYKAIQKKLRPHRPYAHIAVQPILTDINDKDGKPKAMTEVLADLNNQIIFTDRLLTHSRKYKTAEEPIDPVLFFSGEKMISYMRDFKRSDWRGVKKVGFAPEGIRYDLDVTTRQGHQRTIQRHLGLDLLIMPEYADSVVDFTDADERLLRIPAIPVETTPRDPDLGKKLAADHRNKSLLVVVIPEDMPSTRDNAKRSFFNAIATIVEQHPETYVIIIKQENSNKDDLYDLNHYLSQKNGYEPMDSEPGILVNQVLPMIAAHPDAVLLLGNNDAQALTQAVETLPAHKLHIMDIAPDDPAQKMTGFFHEAGRITIHNPDHRIIRPKSTNRMDIPSASMAAYHLIDAFAPVF
jgi:hypothetical protein